MSMLQVKKLALVSVAVVGGSMVMGCATTASRDNAKMLSTMEARMNGERMMREDCEARLDRQQKAALGWQNKAASNEEMAEVMRRRAAQRKAIYARLKNSLYDMVNTGLVKVRLEQGRLVLQMSEKILFDTNKFEVLPQGKKAIARVTKALNTFPRRWMVAGHTDTNGNSRWNWQLSMRRAQSVLEVMLANGFPAKHIAAVGFGQYQPVATNKTINGRAMNRRVELILVPDLNMLPSAIKKNMPQSTDRAALWIDGK